METSNLMGRILLGVGEFINMKTMTIKFFNKIILSFGAVMYRINITVKIIGNIYFLNNVVPTYNIKIL